MLLGIEMWLTFMLFSFSRWYTSLLQCQHINSGFLFSCTPWRVFLIFKVYLLMQQPYTNALPSSLPSSLLAQSAQPPREFDLPFSALLTTQSMPPKYNTTSPSISGTLSMPEVPDIFWTALYFIILDSNIANTACDLILPWSHTLVF